MANTKVTSAVIADGAITPSKIASGDFYFDTNTLYIDSTNNRIGIGNANPDTKLSVGTFGDTARAAVFNGGSILIDGGAASEIIIGDGNVAYMSIQTTDNATAMNIRDFSGSSDLVTIERASGNVGIGTTNPSSMLHLSDGVTGVSGGEAAAITMTNKFDNPDNSWTIKPQRTGISNTGLEIRDVTDSRSVMSFDGEGNVGIGTATPANGTGTPLTLSSATGYVGLRLNGTGSYANDWDLYASGNGSGLDFFGIYDRTNTTYRLVTTNTGMVMINSTSDNGNRLQVVGNISQRESDGHPYGGFMRSTVVSVGVNGQADIFRFLDNDGNVINTSGSAGSFYVNIIATDTGANQASYHYSYMHTGNGQTDDSLVLLASVVRGTNPVSSIVMVSDGTGGASKMQVNLTNGKAATCRVTYVGNIYGY